MGIRPRDVKGKIVYDVYVTQRSKDQQSLRVQKFKRGILTEKEARKIEKQCISECAMEIARLEQRGLNWQELMEKYEEAHLRRDFGVKNVQANTIWESMSTLRKFTKEIIERPCSEITPGDIKKIFREMYEAEYSYSRIKAVKSAINTVFNWGIEERVLPTTRMSPASLVKIDKQREEKAPDILKTSEIHRLIECAREMNHPWYSVWFTALNTGMRSGELYALEWKHVDFENKMIRVEKSYNNRLKVTKSTKAGYWRNVPINKELESLLRQLAIRKDPDTPHVLPRLSRWSNGEAAKFLREFCEQIGISSVNFHALRACFATHLLNSGVPSPVVKSICGWTEEKVMGRYIRLAGIDVQGATEHLSWAKQTPPEAGGKVVNLWQVRVPDYVKQSDE